MSVLDPSRARQLREEFDQAFALPARVRDSGGASLLSIRVGGDPYLLSLEELSGLVADRPLLPLPTQVPGFLGLVAVRSGLVPVYGLQSLLGYPVVGGLRWLALARQARVGLLFESYEGLIRIPPEQVVTDPGSRPQAGLTPKAARVEGVLRPVIDLQATLSFIRQRGPVSASRE